MQAKSAAQLEHFCEADSGHQLFRAVIQLEELPNRISIDTRAAETLRLPSRQS
jgi:hypothetical protein